MILFSFHLVTDNSPLASYFYISGIQPDTEYGSLCIRLSKKSDSRPKNAAAFFKQRQGNMETPKYGKS